MKKKYSKRELRAMGFAVADEILTRAQKFERLGMTRIAAINKAMAEMAA